MLFVIYVSFSSSSVQNDIVKQLWETKIVAILLCLMIIASTFLSFVCDRRRPRQLIHVCVYIGDSLGIQHRW